MNTVHLAHYANGTACISKGSCSLAVVGDSARAVCDAGTHCDVPHTVNIIVADGLLGVPQGAGAGTLPNNWVHGLHCMGVHLIGPLTAIVLGGAVGDVSVSGAEELAGAVPRSPSTAGLGGAVSLGNDEVAHGATGTYIGVPQTSSICLTGGYSLVHLGTSLAASIVLPQAC